MEKVSDQERLIRKESITYKIPEGLKNLDSKQRMRVLSARVEQAKQQADEKLLAFAARTHPNQLSTLNFFLV